MKYGTFLLILGAVLSGCSTPPPLKSYQAGYISRDPLAVSVKRVQIEQYAPDCNPGKDLLGISLPDMLYQWAQGRFVSSGGMCTLKIVIMNANLQEKSVPIPDGIEHVFSQKPRDKYEANITVIFDLINSQGKSLHRAEVNLRDEKYVLDSYNIQQRRKILLAFYESLLDRLTQKAEELVSNMLRSR